MGEVKSWLLIFSCLLWGLGLPLTLYGTESKDTTLSLDSLFILAQAHVQQQKGFDYTTQLLERSRNEKDRYHEASAMFW